MAQVQGRARLMEHGLEVDLLVKVSSIGSFPSFKWIGSAESFYTFQ